MSKKNEPRNAEKLSIAREIVYKYHGGQWRRRYPLPYDAHVYVVSHRLAKWGITDRIPYVMECAMTHDVIEDAGSRAPEAGEEIYLRLGVRYYEIVMELTFQYDSSLGTEEHHRKKAEYLASFDRKSVEALVVKAADRISNTEDFEPSHEDTNATRQLNYLRNAASLFIALGRRRPEIEAAFGVHFYKKMAADIQRVHEGLGVELPALL